MGNASEVLASVVLVCNRLTALAKRLPVSHVRRRHNHVTAKGELSRRRLKDCMEGCIESPLDGSEKILLDVGERLKRDSHQLERAKLVRDDLMSALENRVGLRIGGAGDARSDAVGLEKFLEFDAGEFSSLVVKADHGPGVSAEPGTVECTSNGTGLFVCNGEKFHVVGCWVDHGESQNLNRFGRRTVEGRLGTGIGSGIRKGTNPKSSFF